MVRAVCTEAMRDFRLHVVNELTQTDRYTQMGGKEKYIKKNREIRKKEQFTLYESPKIDFCHIWISFLQF